MPSFRVLTITEHVNGEPHKLDHKLCILYDESEEKFFYFGTRNRENQTTYANYKGSFDFAKKEDLVSFIAFLMDDFDEVLTLELHTVGIHENEYTYLNYPKLISKMGNDTLLAAYDEIKETKRSIRKYLSFL